MNDIEFDWSEFRIFAAVAELGSLSAAARHLHISQPTVGRAITRLERRFDAPLFQRHARGLTLTPLGQQVHIQAQTMRQAAAGIDMLRTQGGDAVSGTVRITAPMVMAHFLLPEILAQIRTDYPQIEIELVASDRPDNLLFHDADIALRTFETQQLEIITTKLAEFDIAIVASASYLAKRGVPETPHDLRQHDIIGYDKNTAIILGFRAMEWDLDPHDFALRCDDQAAYWQLVLAGCGIGFMPWRIAQKFPQIQRVLEGVEIPRLPLYLASHPRVLAATRVQTVWRALRAAIGRPRHLGDVG